MSRRIELPIRSYRHIYVHYYANINLFNPEHRAYCEDPDFRRIAQLMEIFFPKLFNKLFIRTWWFLGRTFDSIMRHDGFRFGISSPIRGG